MPEMWLRFKRTVKCPPGVMAEAAAARVRQLTGKSVAWEVQLFGQPNDGQPDYALLTVFTDNFDEHVELAERIQGEVLTIMASMATTDEMVGHWVQRVKGKWSEINGTKSP